MGYHIKICCIRSHDEADLAIAAGASALGLVSQMPSGPGVIDDDTAAELAAHAAGRAQTFLLTSLTTADRIIEQQQRVGATTLQLVDHVPHDDLRRLRDGLPSTRLVQVIHVLDDSAVDEAVAAAPLVDAILLDSGNPRLAIKQLGGTGRAHNWAISRRIVAAVPCPVWLAGGLRAGNVADALNVVRPYGVDICSGVRLAGNLDPALLAEFVASVRAAS